MAKKIDLVNGAYEELRISGLTVDPSPADAAVALDRLETMAAEWYETRNVRVNYNFEDDPEPNSESGIQRAYKNTFETNLAVKLASLFGKDIPQLLFARANAAFSAMSGNVFPLGTTAYPSRQPVGSGNVRGGRYVRYYPGSGSVDLDSTVTQDKDAVEGYEVSWTEWLTTGGTLTSSSWFIEEGDNKLILTDPAYDQEKATVTISGGTQGYLYRVTNRVVSSTGRANDYSIYIRIT